jgi:hypothetical protein
MAWQMYDPVPVKFGWKRHVWDTPCIAGVSSRSLSLMSRPMSRSKMSRLSHAVYGCVLSRSLSLMSISLNFMARISVRGTPTNVYDRTYISLHVYNSNFKQSIRFLATITMKRRLHGCRIVNMQKYVGAVRHRGLALRVAAIQIFYVSTVRWVP